MKNKIVSLRDIPQSGKDLPDKAGVYFFKNAEEQVIYVGKAKNLKKRVKNHFQKPDQHAFDFIAQVADIDFIETANEKDALILEQQFIKKLQPRWNIEWKDDKNYFYIVCGKPSRTAISNEYFPRVCLTHQPSLVEVVEVKPPLIILFSFLILMPLRCSIAHSGLILTNDKIIDGDDNNLVIYSY